MSAVRAIRPAPTPPFIVDELPPAKSGTKSAWRIMAEANPGKWVVVQVTPGTCAERATKATPGIKSAMRRLTDASAYGVNGPAVLTFAMYVGQVAK